MPNFTVYFDKISFKRKALLILFILVNENIKVAVANNSASPVNSASADPNSVFIECPEHFCRK
jgi:hypothetical protein